MHAISGSLDLWIYCLFKGFNVTVVKLTVGLRKRILVLSALVLQVFVGNSDGGTVVKHPLIPSIKARYIRLVPQTWHKHISTRMELYGCLGIVSP